MLLAERDRYAAELLEYFLRTEGYDVCVALRASTGPSNCSPNVRPHLSILELMMSGGGLELCARLAGGDTPVLAMSALDLADQAMAAGASAFLAKPVVPLQFVSTVRDLLGSSALTRPSKVTCRLMQRLSTGNPRLDEILGGGLMADAITLVVGAPGTGQDDPGRTVSVRQRHTGTSGAVSLDGVGTVRQAAALRAGAVVLRHRTQVGRSVFYDDLGDAVHQDGLTAVSERIDALIKQHRPGIIVIDSFKALRTFAASDADFRRFLHDLAGRLTAIAVSSLWVGEYEPGEATDSPEFAVADAVIGVETKRTSERSIRYLSVRKLRGSDFLSGDHVYRITSDGLVVFPRLADPRDDAPHHGGRRACVDRASPRSTTPSRMATGPDPPR